MLHAIGGDVSMVAGDASILSTQHVSIKLCFRARELAPCLKALAALSEEDLIPSTRMTAQSVSNSSSREFDALFWPPQVLHT